MEQLHQFLIYLFGTTNVILVGVGLIMLLIGTLFRLYKDAAERNPSKSNSPFGFDGNFLWIDNKKELVYSTVLNILIIRFVKTILLLLSFEVTDELTLLIALILGIFYKETFKNIESIKNKVWQSI
jgi:hypothetical protein